MRVARALCSAAIALAICPARAGADEFATSPARPDYQASEKVLMWDARAKLEERGLIIDGTYAFELFLAPDLDEELVAAGLFTLEVDLSLERMVSDALGDFHLSAFAIHGGSVTDELMDIHGTSGNAGAPDVRLFEAWIDQPVGPLVLRGGLLATDQEFVVADRSGTLLGATFGMTGQFSAQAAGPVFPVATPAASLRIETPVVMTRFAIYDGAQENTHGIPTGLDSYLAIGEVGLTDLLKFGAWHHGEKGGGLYAIADAQLAPALGAFARAGIADGPVSTYLDAGIRATPGTFRPDDFISVGVAFSRREREGMETVVEATYEAQIRWLTIQPDVQIMFLPGRTVAMVATRATMTF